MIHLIILINTADILPVNTAVIMDILINSNAYEEMLISHRGASLGNQADINLLATKP